MCLLLRVRSTYHLAAAVLVLLSQPAVAESDYLDPATGYRLSHYRAVVPDTVPGGKRVTTEEAEQLFKSGNVAFIDVMPSTGASFDPKTGEWRLTKKHVHIPGSKWLPGVGGGNPGVALVTYFAENLGAITAGDKTSAILIYCQSDCWMAWNAVKRAASFGYTNIYWYPDGVNGWTDWDNPTAPAEPVPVTVGAPSQ